MRGQNRYMSFSSGPKNPQNNAVTFTMGPNNPQKQLIVGKYEQQKARLPSAFFNILIRNTYRPESFKKCIRSVLNQTYDKKNVRIICCYDDKDCLDYLSYFKGRENFDIFEVVPTSEECFYNLYSNQLLDRVEKGWIIFLDDDDMFSGVDVLKKINGSIKNFDNNAIFFWYHKRSDRVIYPPDLRNIQKSSIASCSYCFNSKYKNLSRWNTGQTGDFEFLDQLLRKNKFNRVGIGEALTTTDVNGVGSYGAKEIKIRELKEDKLREMKFSIVMAYYNRKSQTILTLDQFERLYANKYNKYNFEVVIVDDCSDDKEKLSDIVKEYSFDIKYIELENKTWKSPVVPNNVAISNISPDVDIVIFQNPEIFHCADVFHYLFRHLRDSNYLTFPVFSSPTFHHNANIRKLFSEGCNNYYTEFIEGIDYKEFGFDYEFYTSNNLDVKDYSRDEARAHFLKIGIREGRGCNKHDVFFEDKVIDEWKGWFNHIKHNPRNFHFLSAMRKSVLDKVGGFCNEMKYGMWYDDDDFLSRIQKVAQVKTVDSNVNMGIHQYHNNSSSEAVYKATDSAILRGKNHQIYQQNIRDNTIYCNPYVNDTDNKFRYKWNEVRYVNFSFYRSQFGNYYYNKLNENLHCIKKICPKILVTKIDTNKFIFGESSAAINENNFLDIANRLEIKSNVTYIFDEISYPHFLGCYANFPKHRKTIKNFLENAKYIVFFCEIFENLQLRTYGNVTENLEFAKLFFKNAKVIILCNYNNISCLKQHGISENIIYFPLGGRMNHNVVHNNQKKLDILMYGSNSTKNTYRYNLTNKIRKYCDCMDYTIELYSTERGLFGKELDSVLSDVKIVIHIPSFENLQTFPWAKCSKLFSSKVFVLIEDNNEVKLLNAKGLNVATYDPCVENDIREKINKYLKDDILRDKHTESCYNFMKNNYDMENLFNNIFT